MLQLIFQTFYLSFHLTCLQFGIFELFLSLIDVFIFQIKIITLESSKPIYIYIYVLTDGADSE